MQRAGPQSQTVLEMPQIKKKKNVFSDAGTLAWHSKGMSCGRLFQEQPQQSASGSYPEAIALWCACSEPFCFEGANCSNLWLSPMAPGTEFLESKAMEAQAKWGWNDFRDARWGGDLDTSCFCSQTPGWLEDWFRESLYNKLFLL